MGKVALVHDFLTTFGGAERVLAELAAMFPGAPIYTLLADANVAAAFKGHAVVTSSLNRHWLRNRPQLLIGKMPQAVEEFSFEEFDTVISSSGAFAHGAITGPDTYHLCYCHSPMRYVWDWHSEYLSERGIMSVPAKAAANQLLSPIRLWDSFAASRPDHYAANSKTVQRRISHYYRQPSTVVYPPVQTGFWVPGEEPQRYAITVSRLSTYKRVDALIRACTIADIPLVVVGEGSERGSLERLAASLGADVRFTGRIEDSELLPLLQRASVFLYAAEEDFGIAPVEALSCGVPVVALGTGGTGETVVNGENGLLFTHPEPDLIANCIRQVLAGTLALNRSQISQTAKQYGAIHFQDAVRALLPG